MVACVGFFVACGDDDSEMRDVMGDTPNDAEADAPDDASDDVSMDAPPPVPPTIERPEGDFPWSDAERSLTSPDCTAEDALIIERAEDLNRVNDPNFRVFCITPGDYRDFENNVTNDVFFRRDFHRNNVFVDSSGTEAQPRVLALYNPERPNDRRAAAQLPESERAVLRGFFLRGASHWVIDRLTFDQQLSSFNVIESDPAVEGDFARNNTINGCHFYDLNHGILVRNHVAGTTIQNSLFHDVRPEVEDRIAIHLSGASDEHYQDDVIIDTTIVNNECYNTTDCVQLVNGGQTEEIDGVETSVSRRDFSGTLIDNNDFYNDNTIPGVLSECERFPGEQCNWFENAVDIKAGSLDPERPVVIQNVRAWGFYRRHFCAGCSGDPGVAFVAHLHAKNVHFLSNIVFDSNLGVTLDPWEDVRPQSGIRIEDNLFRGMRVRALSTSACEGARILRNTIRQTPAWNYFLAGRDQLFECNVVIDSGFAGDYDPGNTYRRNAFYGVPAMDPRVTEDPATINEASVEAAMMQEHCFDTRMWTGPVRECLDHFHF